MTLLYRLATGAVRLFAPLLSLGDSKFARGIQGRRGADDLLTVWGTAVRDRSRPVVWFHAPSVGEGLQAQAVLEALRARCPEVQIVYTFFSPSAESLARRIGAEVATYLPWDLHGPVRRVLESVEPHAIVFTKTEVWPTVVAEAAARGVPTAIVGTTVPEGAKRSGRLARAFLAGTWERLELACVNSEADAAGLRHLGVRPEVIEITGDPGIDSAATRFDDRDRDAAWINLFEGESRPCIVAGSTWGPDERVLLPALELVRRSVPDVRVVVAPHEPSEEAVRALGDSFRSRGWTTSTLAESESSSSLSDAVVVERVGVLAELYGVATAAFVGGGFHSAGLHSVLEPAAAACPVVFGPAHNNARAAGDLVREGGAKIASDPEQLAGVLIHWLSDPDAQRSTGEAAAAYIHRHRGAAARSAALVHSLIS